MRRAVALGSLVLAAACSQPAAETTTKPYVIKGGTRLPYVCGLVSAERVGQIFDVSGVEAKDTSAPDSGSRLGACTYSAGTFELIVEAYPMQEDYTPAEFALSALNGEGRPVDELGDAAALAEWEDGVSRLVMVQDDVVLQLTGAGEPENGLADTARETLPRLDALW